MISTNSLITTALLGITLFANGLLAAEWQNEVGLSVGSFYSDNICLRNSNPEEHVVGTVTPDISMMGSGARANLALRGAVEFNSLGKFSPDCRFAGAGNRRTVIPSLRFLGDIEVIDEWLTLEADAFAGRNRIDQFSAGGDVFSLENINITYQYGVGAVLQRRLLKIADMRLRYRYSEQRNDTNFFGDRRQDQVEFDLGTDRRNASFSTGVSGRYRKVYFDESRHDPAFNNTLSSAELWAALQLTTSLEVNAKAGEEWNQFTSTRDEIDGSYWDAGLAWTPNERVEVGVGTGERFFGTTSRFNIRYRHKRSVLSANYAHTLTFPSDLRAGSGGFADPLDPGPEDFDNRGFDSGFGQRPGESRVVQGDPTFIGDGPIIDKRFTLQYQLIGRRSALMASASESRQMRLEDGEESTFRHISAILSRDLSPHLTADLGLSWSDREGQSVNVGQFGGQAETWRIGPGISRVLGTDTMVTLRHQYTRQRSDLSQNQYEENRITLSFIHRLRPVDR